MGAGKFSCYGDMLEGPGSTPGNARFSARVRVTLQLTVSQSVRLGVEPNLGLLTRILQNSSLLRSVWSCGGTRMASYPIRTEVSFLGGDTAGAST
jgi:hypothetical protein